MAFNFALQLLLVALAIYLVFRFFIPWFFKEEEVPENIKEKKIGLQDLERASKNLQREIELMEGIAERTQGVLILKKRLTNINDEINRIKEKEKE